MAASKAKTILIIDDDPEFLRYAERVARGIGYTPSMLATAAEALIVLQSEGTSGLYEVVLCDVQMPEMDGVQFLRNLRASGGENAPLVIAVTSQPYANTVKELAQLEVDGVLCKPITAESLGEAVEKALLRRTDREYLKMMKKR